MNLAGHEVQQFYQTEAELFSYTYLLFYPTDTIDDMCNHILSETKKYGFEIVYKFNQASEYSEITQLMPIAAAYWHLNQKKNDSTKLTGFLLLDLNPISLTTVESRLYPALTNARLLHLSYAIKRKLSHLKQKNALIFTSVTKDEVQLFLDRKDFSNAIPCIESSLKKIFKAFSTPYNPMFSIYQYSFSAKIDIVYHNEKMCVLKTFRPSCSEHLKNELIAYQLLSSYIPEIPTLLDYGENYILIPYYPAQKKFNFSGITLLSVSKAKSMFKVLEKVYNLGYSLIDSHPKNFLYDTDNNIKIIDFEYLFKYKHMPKSFSDSLDIKGYQEDFPGLRPADLANYNTRWLPYIGLSYHSLMSDSSRQQIIKKSFYWLTRRLPIFLTRRIYMLYKYIFSRTISTLLQAKIHLKPPIMRP